MSKSFFIFDLRIARVENNLTAGARFADTKTTTTLLTQSYTIVGFAGGQEVSVFVGWRSYYSVFIFMLDVSVSIMRGSRGG